MGHGERRVVTVLMPLADGQKISQQVLTGLSGQTVQCDLVPITRPRHNNRMVSILATRNELTNYADGEYCLMMDSDVVICGETDVDDLRYFLEGNPEIDAVALNVKHADIKHEHEIGHVNVACMMIKTRVLQRISFKVLSDGMMPGCECRALSKEIKARYIDDRPVEEISR